MKQILLFVLILFTLFIVACAPAPIQNLAEADIETNTELEQDIKPIADIEPEPELDLEPVDDLSELVPDPELTPDPTPEPIPILLPEDVMDALDLADVLEELAFEERAEPIVHLLLQKERGVYTIDKKRYVIYFQSIRDSDTVEMRIEGDNMDVDLGESVKMGLRYNLNLVNIFAGGSEIVGDLVKFYYGTQSGLINDYIEEGETKTYTRNGQKHIITLIMVSDFPEVKAIFEIDGKRTGSLESKDQELFDDKSFLFVSNIFPNEASEYSTQKYVEFTITKTQ